MHRAHFRGCVLATLLACSLHAAAQQPAERSVPFEKPQGIYATIRTGGTETMINHLSQLMPGPRRDAIAVAVARAASLAPPALYALANAVAQDDKNMEDAVFWYHVGRIRAVYDGLRCKDASARNIIAAMGRGLNPDLTRYQRQRRQLTLRIAVRAVKWDSENPRNYDHRWINLNGTVARYSAGTDPSELTVPESEWPAILKRVHETHLMSVEEFAREKLM
jgi:hypothetical protein